MFLYGLCFLSKDETFHSFKNTWNVFFVLILPSAVLKAFQTYTHNTYQICALPNPFQISAASLRQYCQRLPVLLPPLGLHIAEMQGGGKAKTCSTDVSNFKDKIFPNFPYCQPFTSTKYTFPNTKFLTWNHTVELLSTVLCNWQPRFLRMLLCL